MPRSSGAAAAPPEAELRAQIDRLFARWARALDHGDLDELLSTYTHDAVLRPAPGVELRGLDAIRERYAGRRGVRTTRHLYSGVLVEARGVEEARVISVWATFAANTVAPVGEAQVYQVADVEDVLRRGDDGRWRIARRTISAVFLCPSLAPVPS